MSKKTKQIAMLGLCTALSMVLAYVEILIQPLFPTIPGIKMGLPNVIIVFLLYRMGPGYAAGVSLLRIFLVSVLFGNSMAFMYSIAGGILSLLVMILLKRLNFMSAVGVSVAGGVTHNIGQILVAAAVMKSFAVMAYLPVLLISGVVTGTFTGFAAQYLTERLEKK